jgi:ABC-type polysaccharide transport system permease subunit
MEMNTTGTGTDRLRSGPRPHNRLAKYIRKNFFFLMLLLPGTLLIVVFYYIPYFGLVMGFKDFPQSFHRL